MFLSSNRRAAFQRTTELLSKQHTINGVVLDGIDGVLIEVQSSATGVLKTEKPWSKCVSVTGMPRSEATAMLQRINAVLASQGAPNCKFTITLNIHPTAAGRQLDLAAVLALMLAHGLVDQTYHANRRYVVFGALDSHGGVRRVDGALPLSLATRHGDALIVPEENSKQCLLAKAVRDISIYPVQHLVQAVAVLKGVGYTELVSGKIHAEPVIGNHPDFGDIVGQEPAKRAAVVAAAGGHSMLMNGTPGSGKTMIANAIAGILPPLSNQEKIELTRIWNAAGLILDGQAVTRRPFRVVHHTATQQALIGGGRNAAPGEVTLAHLGVLFLDEIAEFKPAVLDSLRQPLEDGVVRVTRVYGRAEYPSRFSLVAAMNPCECGYYPDCSCGEAKAAKYQAKLSGPLLERIDLKIPIQLVDPTQTHLKGLTTEEIRGFVVKAVDMQRNRFSGTTFRSNADVPGQLAIRLFNVDTKAMEEITKIITTKHLSMRVRDRIIKVARTIADLSGSDSIKRSHADEAAVMVAM